MFYGFKSLCTSPQLCMVSNRSTIWIPRVITVSSLNFLLYYTKSRSRSTSYRGMTMKLSPLSSSLPLASNFAKRLAKIVRNIILNTSCTSNFFNYSHNLDLIFILPRSLLVFGVRLFTQHVRQMMVLTNLMATSYPFSMCLAKKTSPKAPPLQ